MLDILQSNADMEATEDQFSFSSWEFDDDDEDILPADEDPIPSRPSLPLIVRLQDIKRMLEEE